jgi:hypothetical protein
MLRKKWEMQAEMPVTLWDYKIKILVANTWLIIIIQV